MLDFGWPELLVIMAVAVFVIGPKEIPSIMYGFGRLVRRLQYVKFAFSQQFEDFMRAHDLDDIQRSVNFEAPEYDEAAADEEALAQETDAVEDVPEKSDRPSEGDGGAGPTNA